MLMRTSSGLKGADVTHSYCPLSLSGPHHSSGTPAMDRIRCAGVLVSTTVEARWVLATADWEEWRPQAKPATDRALATSTIENGALSGTLTRSLLARRISRLRNLNALFI